MELNKAIQSRKSCRKFTSKKPDWRDIVDSIDSMRFSPKAGNNFNVKTIIVKEKEAIEKIAKSCQQDFIQQAHYIVVVCSDDTRLKNLYEKQGEKFARQQTGAAMQNFILSIEDKGLATCWVGYFVENQIREILKIPGNVKVEAIFPIGYEMGKQKTSTKSSLDSYLFFEKYGNKKMKPIFENVKGIFKR